MLSPYPVKITALKAAHVTPVAPQYPCVPQIKLQA